MAITRKEAATNMITQHAKGWGLSTTPTTESIMPSEIRRDGGTQARVGLNEDTVATYCQDYNDGASLPPIELYFDDTHYWLWDGFHRVEAWLRSQNRAGAIPCVIRHGTRREAVLAACGANNAHGLRRKAEDIQRAVETLLRDDEWMQWSDRAIARACACSPTTVGTARARLVASVQIGQMDTRTVERNGTTYQQAPRKSGGSRNGSGGGSWSAEPADVAAMRDRVEALGATFDGIPNARGQYRAIFPDHDLLGTIAELRPNIAVKEQAFREVVATIDNDDDVAVTPIPIADIATPPIDDRAPLFRKRLRDAFRDDDEQAEGIAALALGCHLLGLRCELLAEVLDDETYGILAQVMQ